MIYYVTPKTPLKDHLRYGMFEIDNDGRLISIGWEDDLNDLTRYRRTFDDSILMWNRSYPVDNFLKAVSKNCIVFTKESNPELFI